MRKYVATILGVWAFACPAFCGTEALKVDQATGNVSYSGSNPLNFPYGASGVFSGTGTNLGLITGGTASFSTLLVNGQLVNLTAPITTSINGTIITGSSGFIITGASGYIVSGSNSPISNNSGGLAVLESGTEATVSQVNTLIANGTTSVAGSLFSPLSGGQTFYYDGMGSWTTSAKLHAQTVIASNLPGQGFAGDSGGLTGTAPNQTAGFALASGISNSTNDTRMMTQAALGITSTGNWQYNVPIFLCPPDSVQMTNGSLLIGGSGKWIESFNYTETSSFVNHLTYLSLNDVYGIRGNFSPGFTSTSITGISVSATVIEGNFAPSYTAPPNISAPNLIYLGGNLTFSTMAVSYSFPNLTEVVGGITFTGGLPSPGTIAFPLLTDVASFTIGSTSNVSVLDLHSLVNCQGNLTVTTALTSATLTNLAYVGGFTGPTTGFNLNCPSLVELGTGSLVMQSISLNFPAIVKYDAAISFSGGDTTLVSATFGTVGTLKSIPSIALTGTPMNQTSVDGLMTLLASLNGSNGTTNYTGVTNISGGTAASPTASGTTTTAGSNFVGSGTTCTATITAHGYSTGDVLQVTGVTTLTNADKYAIITVTDSNHFTYTITSQTATGAGTATVKRYPSGNAVNTLVTRGVTLTTN